MTPCILWAGTRNPDGYGKRGDNYAHRLAWEAAFGPIPPGLCVLHRCDVRPCVNPEHLFLGTKGDNARDREAKGRGRTNGLENKTHCPAGHPYSLENTYQSPPRPGRTSERHCRSCNRASSRRYQAKRRGTTT